VVAPVPANTSGHQPGGGFGLHRGEPT
jgi:hypothetical protein